MTSVKVKFSPSSVILKGKHSINSPFHSKKCDITFVIKVKKLNCYVTSMDHGRF